MGDCMAFGDEKREMYTLTPAQLGEITAPNKFGMPKYLLLEKAVMRPTLEKDVISAPGDIMHDGKNVGKTNSYTDVSNPVAPRRLKIEITTSDPSLKADIQKVLMRDKVSSAVKQAADELTKSRVQ